MADLPPIPDPNQPFVNPQTGMVDPEWFRFLLAFTEFASDTSDLDDGLAGKAGLPQVDGWSDHIVEVDNGDIVVIQKAPFAGTITSTVTDCDSGTCTMTFKIDGVAVGGSANAVSTTESDVARTAANTFTAGQTISYTISANASCLGARAQINYSRDLAA